MKNKLKKKTIVEQMREIRDKLSLDIQNMSAIEIEEYFKNKKKKHGAVINSSMVAEPKVKYGRNK